MGFHNARHRTLFLTLGLIVLTHAACAGPPETEPALGRTQQKINDGQVEQGENSVVVLYHQTEGVMCTGTIIGQRVVLTAKHCVRPNEGAGPGEYSASGWTVNVGPSIYNTYRTYYVQEVRYTAGTVVDDNDIAVMIIDGLMTDAPYPLYGALSNGFIYDNVYLIGYGINSCSSSSSGVKYRTTDQVIQWYGNNSFITQGNGANQGDSGGPVFNANYEVVGVMVAMGGNCSEGITICTRIDKFTDLIQTALEDTGGCYPTGEEICGDGIDNDCQNGIDDGCADTGEPCTQNDDCATQFCVDLGAGLVCAQPCDPQTPFTGCVSGLYCKELDCGTGACVMGTPGAGEFMQQCSTDAQCQSLYCKPASDGHSYCGIRCVPDQGQCLPNEVCAPMGMGCGSCQFSTVYNGQSGLGETCSMNAHCRNGLCLEDQGAHYCSHQCAAHADCPDGFHCRSGYCVRGYIGGDGDPCMTSDDCGAPTTCYDDGNGSYCTQMGCDTGTPCPSYMTCTMVGQTGVCTLTLAPAGNACDSNVECLSGGCLRFDGQGICTLTCDRDMPCPAGTYCTVSDSGVLACAPNSMPPTNPDVDPPGGSTGGCATGESPPASWLWLGLLLLALRRRRR